MVSTPTFAHVWGTDACSRSKRHPLGQKSMTCRGCPFAYIQTGSTVARVSSDCLGSAARRFVLESVTVSQTILSCPGSRCQVPMLRNTWPLSARPLSSHPVALEKQQSGPFSPCICVKDTWLERTSGLAILNLLMRIISPSTWCWLFCDTLFLFRNFQTWRSNNVRFIAMKNEMVHV